MGTNGDDGKRKNGIDTTTKKQSKEWKRTNEQIEFVPFGNIDYIYVNKLVFLPMLVADKNIFKDIPLELESSWIVNFLNTGKFTVGHMRLLREKANTSDRVLSSVLNLAPKTFVGYTKDISKIKVDTKEHVLMLISLLKHGQTVFGSEENFSQWLDTKNVFMDNKKPMELLNTISGIRLVDDRLVAIEYGDNV